MQGYMVTIDPDKGLGGIQVLTKPPTLAETQKAVGGLIEHVPYFETFKYGDTINKCVALCNEEGKLHGLPYNPHAQGLWQATLARDMNMAPFDMLVGPVVILWGDDAFMQEL